MSRLRLVLGVILSVVLVLNLTGCGTTTDVDEPGEPTDSPEDRRGGTLVIANEQNPFSLNPEYVADTGSMRAIHYMYNSLIRLNDKMEWEGALAESWEISDDLLTYTFYLRPGVKFHDGTDFNAEAVKFNYERKMDPELGTRLHDTVIRDIKSVEVLDDHTVRFVLNHPNVQWLYNLQTHGNNIISPTAVEKYGEDFARNPVGTGPFMFEEFEPDSHLHMVRFEDYWEGAPLLDRVHVRIIPETSVQILELEAGNIDFSFTVQAKDVERLKRAGLDIHQTYTPTASFLSMHLGLFPTSELAVRKAIAHAAVDAEAVLSELLLGFGTISQGGTPSPDWPLWNPNAKRREYNPDEARRILDEAGWILADDGIRYRDGEPLEVLVLSAIQERQLDYGLMNEIIQDGLASVGFKTEIQTLDWGAYNDRFRAGDNWHVTFHAQNQRDPSVAYGAAIDPDAHWNINKHHLATEPYLVESADRIREIFRLMDLTPDFEDRKAMWFEVQEICHEQALIPWLVHWQALFAINPRVQGLRIVPITTDIFYAHHETWLSD